MESDIHGSHKDAGSEEYRAGFEESGHTLKGRIMDGPLINLKTYTPLEMILFAGGCYIWVVVYVIYIRHIMKRRMIGMPVFAAASNIAWELVWGFVPPFTDMGLIVVWGYRIWFLLDLL